MMNIDKSKIQAESYKKVVTFDMQFNQEGSDFILNKQERIIIEKISFHKPMSVLNYILTGVLVLYYSGLIIFLVAGKIAEKTEQLPLQKPIEVYSHRDVELKRIKEFIELNYSDVNISTRMVYERLGIPSYRVFKLLKEEYQLTFKQLINRMRIKEAKRLLKETDLRIIEIALQLGFNNISYFNNLFKTYEKQTPSEYRKNNNN
jgi:AraC-like DNA-binding protein